MMRSDLINNEVSSKTSTIMVRFKLKTTINLWSDNSIMGKQQKAQLPLQYSEGRPIT